jgi:phosphatidylethanolamine/phosphatidyl-N-methylethanolamine N-methyltransferase
VSTLDPTAASPIGWRRPPAADAWVFLREFVRSPLRTASVVPSSRALAARMVEPLRRSTQEAQDPPVVVELGPGTGSFTRALHEVRPDMRYVGIELNPAMADHLEAQFPGIDLVRGPASSLRHAVVDRGLRADLVVSGLPWQAFAGAEGTDLVAAIAASLAPTGAYTQFTYSWSRWAPPGRRQHHELQRSFGNVELSRTVWGNLPPAVVYTATSPRPVGAALSDESR